MDDVCNLVYDLIVIGGGPAGVFASIIAKSSESGIRNGETFFGNGCKNNLKILIIDENRDVNKEVCDDGIDGESFIRDGHDTKKKLQSERGAKDVREEKILGKLRISGGGRCNITNNLEDLKIFASKYPRGFKEVYPLFHIFGPKDIIEWFEKRGVFFKEEEDGKIFPVSDKSETVIKVLIKELENLDIKILPGKKITKITKENVSSEGLCGDRINGFDNKNCSHGGSFVIYFKEQEKRDEKILRAKNVLLATGGSEKGFEIAKNFGHKIEEPMDALFSFCVKNSPYKEISGTSIKDVRVKINNSHLKNNRFDGDILLTHFGFSGPVILNLSSLAAKHLHENNCNNIEMRIDWLNSFSREEILENFFSLKKNKESKKSLFSENPFNFPKNFWKIFLFDKICEKSLNSSKIERIEDIEDLFFKKPITSIPDKILNFIAEKIKCDKYVITGKNKGMVTCGGIFLKEVNFKNMESKLCSGLYFAGEILNIDGLTGGFNLQNVWTTAFVFGSSFGKKE